MRGFIGRLRGETDHCSMCAIPTLEEEDDKRPNREHEYLVGLRTAIINRLKSCMARLGIRDFNPTLKKAPERLPKLRTAERTPIPPNTLDELKRDIARLRFVDDQITDIDSAQRCASRMGTTRSRPIRRSKSYTAEEQNVPSTAATQNLHSERRREKEANFNSRPGRQDWAKGDGGVAHRHL
jgi:hypothetical protein